MMIASHKRAAGDFLRDPSRALLIALWASCTGACVDLDDLHAVPAGSAPGDDSGAPQGSVGGSGSSCDPPHYDTDGPAPDSTGEPGDTETLPTGGSESGDATTGDEPPTMLCGNAAIDDGEACDDGINDGAYGGCLAGCAGLAPFCGDGVVNDPSEVCDDGNQVNDDGCTLACTQALCGDGIVQGDEVCDGSQLAGATCESLGFPGGTLVCDEKCSELVITDCSPLPSPPGCCAAGEAGACPDPVMTACVCELAPGCCDTAWSDGCVDLAMKACSAQCP